jgi:hypothetical protein
MDISKGLYSALFHTMQMYIKAYKEKYTYKDLMYYQLHYGLCSHIRHRYGKAMEDEFLELTGCSPMHFKFPAPIIYKAFDMGGIFNVHDACLLPRIKYIADLLNIDLSYESRNDTGTKTSPAQGEGPVSTSPDQGLGIQQAEG